MGEGRTLRKGDFPLAAPPLSPESYSSRVLTPLDNGIPSLGASHAPRSHSCLTHGRNRHADS